MFLDPKPALIALHSVYFFIFNKMVYIICVISEIPKAIIVWCFAIILTLGIYSNVVLFFTTIYSVAKLWELSILDSMCF